MSPRILTFLDLKHAWNRVSSRNHVSTNLSWVTWLHCLARTSPWNIRSSAVSRSMEKGSLPNSTKSSKCPATTRSWSDLFTCSFLLKARWNSFHPVHWPCRCQKDLNHSCTCSWCSLVSVCSFPYQALISTTSSKRTCFSPVSQMTSISLAFLTPSRACHANCASRRLFMSSHALHTSQSSLIW